MPSSSRSLGLALVLASAVPALAAAPARKTPGRTQVVSEILSQSVRIRVYDGKRARKAASGVVVSSEQTSRGPETFVVTNEHVVLPEGIADEHVTVLVDPAPGSTEGVREYPARILAQGRVPDMDLALLRIDGVALTPAHLAPEADLALGAPVLISAAPYGKDLSLSSGIVSQVKVDRKSARATMLKTDAPIGYGASGGGIFSLRTGELLGVVEGYHTAKISFAAAGKRFSFDIPMPGETFASPAPKLRHFLEAKGYGALLAPDATKSAALPVRAVAG